MAKSHKTNFLPKIPGVFQDYKYVMLNYREMCVKWNTRWLEFSIWCAAKKKLFLRVHWTYRKCDKASMKHRGNWHRLMSHRVEDMFYVSCFKENVREILWTLALLLYPKEDITVACDSAVFKTVCCGSCSCETSSWIKMHHVWPHSTDAIMEQKPWQTTSGWTHFLATPRNSEGYPFSCA